MKNYELVNIMNGLNKVETIETSVPVSVGFKVMQNKKTIENALVSFEDMKDKIVNKYADGDGEVKPTNKNYKSCLIELNELANQENSDISFKTVKISEIESLELPMNAISALAFMIEE